MSVSTEVDLDLSGLHAAKETPFFAACARMIEQELAAGEETPYLRAVRERVLGREEEFFCETVLPGTRPQERQALQRILAEGDEVEWLTLLCLLYVLAGSSPWLIGTEMCKPQSQRLDRKMLRDVLEYFHPDVFLAVHEGRGWTQRRHGSMAAYLEVARERSGSAAAAHLELLGAPRSLDYGCFCGGLVAAFGSEFAAEGADLPHDSLRGRLERAIASLRANGAVGLEGGVLLDASGALTYAGHHVLDENPNADSPPRDGEYAVVTSNGVLEHITDHEVLEDVVAKMCRLLRPGGLLLVNCMPTWLGWDSHHPISPWWGVLLHRTPRLRRLWGERWREGFTRRVSYSHLVRLLPDDMLPPISLLSRDRRGLGGAALRASARLRLPPAHYLAIPRRC